MYPKKLQVQPCNFLQKLNVSGSASATDTSSHVYKCYKHQHGVVDSPKNLHPSTFPPVQLFHTVGFFQQHPHLECVSMGCLNWRESRAEGRAEQKSSDLIPVQACDWLSRKRNPVRPPVSPVPAKLIFKEGRLDPHVQFQSPMETCSKCAHFDV
jgi:hypothetical protein